MKLWGRLVSGFLLIMVAVFAAIAFVMPERRPITGAAAILLAAYALFGVPALLRLFSSFTGDEDLLANGIPGSATITSLKPTAWRYNRYYPIVRFELRVDASSATCPVKIVQTVDPRLLRRLTPGTIVRVRMDPSDDKKVVIDWHEPIGTAS